MRIAALQIDVAWHERQVNFTKAHTLARQAADGGAELILLPEMFATGFSMDTALTAESLDGPTPQFLRATARELQVAIVAGFALGQSGGKPHNVALAVDRNGRDLACYAKMNLIGLMDEDTHYAPGGAPVGFSLNGVGIACWICYDLRFPEPFLQLADRVQLMLVIASWPQRRQTHWEALLRARAIENQAYIAGVNRTGDGGAERFAGGSVVIDPQGVILAQAGADERILLADIDPAVVHAVREQMPFLKDRLKYRGNESTR